MNSTIKPGIIYEGMIYEDEPKHSGNYPHPMTTYNVSTYQIGNEIFKVITDEACPGIIPKRYLVGTNGNVFDRAIGDFRPLQNARYYSVQLDVIGRKRNSISTQVHRLEFITHHRIVGFNTKKLEVNHIDLDKHNNNIDNLEWTDHKGNMDHALRNKANKNIRDVDEVREMIRLYNEEYMDPVDIAKRYNCETKYVYAIIEGRKFKTIHDEFDVQLRPRTKSVHIPIHMEECIKLFKGGYNYSEIAKIIGMDKSDVGKLIRRYNDEHPEDQLYIFKGKKFKPELVIEICKNLEKTKGQTTRERFNNLVSTLSIENTESNYDAIRKIIYGKCYTNISCNYDI